MQQIAFKDCDCGFIDAKDPTQSTFNSLLFFDFTKATLRQFNQIFIAASYNVTKKASSPYTRVYKTSNVALTPEGLQLTCSTSTDGTTVPVGGIFTRSQNFFYGSYHADVLVGKEEGTVAGLFYYKNDTSEIDVEYLSGKPGPAALQYSVKPQQYLLNGAASKTTLATDTINDTSVPSDWRFVWKPEAVTFGTKGEKVITMNVPSAPGKIMLNHWSDGNPNFSRGPPGRDSTITVKSLQGVYNDTQAPMGLSCRVMKLSLIHI